jgi:hypothetical protein
MFYVIEERVIRNGISCGNNIFYASRKWPGVEGLGFKKVEDGFDESPES